MYDFVLIKAGFSEKITCFTLVIGNYWLAKCLCQEIAKCYSFMGDTVFVVSVLWFYSH